MKLVYFTHSLRSCWNHGNAHFLRGVLRELMLRGVDVIAAEPERGWSLGNLLRDHGQAGLVPFQNAYPNLRVETYAHSEDAEAICANADIVMAHEWNEPWLVKHLGEMRRRGAFTLFFHDTHHRAVSAPEEMRAYSLGNYDGVLAFGEALADVYRGWGWGDRVWVWHEAADARLFVPPAEETERHGLVWIGNWGDEERSDQLAEYLFAPAAALDLNLDIYGVRYPKAARKMLDRHGAHYRGWLPNATVPEVFARHMATVHVPRRFYVQNLPGIPTIRMFEALACGIPLISAPLEDVEQLFGPGTDYLLARDNEDMQRHLRAVAADSDLRKQLAASGLATVRARHTCGHRADQLLSIVAGMRAEQREVA